MSNKQSNIGNNNLNIDLSHVNIYINDTKKNYEVSLKDFFEEYKKKFENIDEIINSKFISQMIVNKTGREEKYCTQKIVSSLVKVGVPLEITYYIVEQVAKEIINKVDDGSIEILSTKEIRKLVSTKLRNYDGSSYGRNDIENWNDKYIRRYGHNNQIVKIYDEKSCKDISYSFINKILIPDIIQTITNDFENVKINNTQKSEIAEEIMEFINNCSLYRINYNVLKSIIIEIATQPPHPWFINSDTIKQIMDYDMEQLNKNLEKLNKVIDGKNANDSFQYILFETLHHSSSLLLAKYNQFLGVKDLSSLFILHDLLKSYNQNNCSDLMLSNVKISRIFSDINFANIDINTFSSLISEIVDIVKNNKINKNMCEKVKRYGEYVLEIVKSLNKEQILDCIEEWKEKDKIILGIKQTLYSVAPYKKKRLDTLKEYFNIKYKDDWFDRKSGVLVYVNFEEKNVQEFIDELIKYESMSLCNTAFVFAETEEICSKIKKIIQRKLQQNSNYSYVILTFNKIQLIDIINTDQKIYYIKELLDSQFYEA